MSVEAVSPFGAPAPEPEPGGPLNVSVQDFLNRLLELDGSDLHLTAGAPPTVRVHGDLMRLDEYPLLDPETLRQLIYAILPQRHRERFEQDLELDTSYSLPGKARFRVNVYMQRDAIGAALRLIPYEIRSLEQLGMPANMADLARLPRGLVLVTGPTGSGKSTTLAAMIDVVNQREVGADTKSFGEALKHVLRQDPDVVLVGEMRDLETISTAVTAAETGHLVFATLHTQDAPQTIDRIIDAFPPYQQQQIRVQLSTSLQGVITQQLLQTWDGKGRVCASEVMIATPAIRNLIREGKVHQIYSSMQAGGRYGMRTMDQALASLVMAGRISWELGLQRCHDPQELARLTGRRIVGAEDA